MTSPAKKIVEIFTDGACSGNPGPGGWAALIFENDGERVVSGAAPHTTNQRMELMAAIEGLAAIEGHRRVLLHTDSSYVMNCFRDRWWARWEANGWRRKEKNKLVPIANEQLWRTLDKLLAKHEVKYTRVAGHSGHVENDRVDELAVAAYQQYL